MTPIRFDIEDPLFWWITIGLSLLWCWGIFQIFASKKPFVRSIFWTIALLGAAALFLRPSIQKSAHKQSFLLLNSPFPKDSLLQFQSRYDSIFSIGWKDPNLDAFANLSSFLTEKNPKQPFKIKGTPLEEFDLNQLVPFSVQLDLSKAASGFRSLKYSKEIYVDEEAILLGAFEQREEKGSRLIYETSTGAKDSILLGTGIQSFSFGFRPKIAGKFLHQLILKNKEGEILTKTAIPIKVIPKQIFSIHLQSASANFEQRYLGDFLKEEGQKAVIRRKISKDKFKNTFINQEAFALSELNKKLLSSIDLLITDTKSLSEMKNELRQLIADQIRLKGMGCFVVMDNKGVYKDWEKTFPPLHAFSWSPSHQESLFFGPQKDSVELPLFSHLPEGGEGLFKGINGKTLVAGKRYGRGQIAVSALPQTFPMILKDQEAAYRLFWTKILNYLGKKEIEKVSWDLGPPEENRAKHPLFLGFRSDKKDKLEISNPLEEKQNPPLSNSINIPDYQQAGFIPKIAGWHQAKVGNEILDFYVYPDSSFSSLHYHKKRLVNMSWLENREETLNATEKKYWSPLPSYWFFLVFFFGIGGLWFIEKLT